MKFLMTHLRPIICSIILLLACFTSRAQDTPLPMMPCGSINGEHAPVTVGLTAPYMPYPSGAIVSCGNHIKLYFDDMAEGIISGNHSGFDDDAPYGFLTVGEVRRNTLCQMLEYLEQTFDFSLVDTGDKLLIHILRSADPVYNPAPIPTTWLARCFPQYDTTTNGIKRGAFADYVISGVNPVPGDFHAVMQVNFDATYFSEDGVIYYPNSIPWQEDGTQPIGCNKYDLWSCLLHEFGHAMGFFSLVGHSEGPSYNFTPHPVVTTHHVFSKIDSSVRVGGNIYPLLTTGPSLMPLLSFSGGVPSLNPSATGPYNNNYWLNGLEAPNNHPMLCGANYPYIASPGQFIAHLDAQIYTYTTRNRVSPGYRAEYVMGPYIIAGTNHRHFTRGDLAGFHDVIGYQYAATFAAANPSIHPSNTAPYSQKMGQYNITRENLQFFAETVTPDYTLVNNTGSFIDMDVATMPGLTDADGDTIRIDTATLVNFRGCGSANNHDRLSWISPGRVLRYTPDTGFYGKAQFGFRVKDHFDEGSFVVMTIEVKRGTNVGNAAGANMVCNPGFERGTEIATTVNPYIANTPGARFGGPYFEGYWQGAVFSDSHPYNFHSNDNMLNSVPCPSSGITSRASQFVCQGVHNATVGNLWLQADGSATSLPGIDNPLVIPGTGGERYQGFRHQAGSYYYLKSDAKHCKRYTLEFDLYRKNQGFSSPLPLQIGFTDTLVDLHLQPTPLPASFLNFSFADTIAPTTHNWVHISIPFNYCGIDSSNILYLGVNDNSTSFDIDNLSLKEDLVPLPLVASISVDSVVPCKVYLGGHDTNAFCNKQYTWATTGGTILSYNTDSTSVTVPSNVTATYSLTVSDGCRTVTDTVRVIDVVPGPIGGPSTLCAGSTATMTNSLTGGSWTSSTPTVATIGSASGVVTALSNGTTTISYAYCGHLVTKALTVIDHIPAITGTFTVCVGADVLLSDASPGGTWSSSNIAVAIVNTAGYATGVAEGTARITYTLSAGCYATQVVTVYALPTLGPITAYGAGYGDLSFCVGATTLLTDEWYFYTSNPAAGMGTWSSDDPSVADITGTSTGINSAFVLGISPGTATIKYTVHSCGLASTSVVVTVNPLPAPITGYPEVCPGFTTSLTDATAGGTWSSSDSSVAVIADPGVGIIDGIAEGTTTITYTLPTGCYVTTELTVNPVLHTITGPDHVCVEHTVTLTETTGPGTWSSADAGIADVGVITGIVTGISAGTTTISYSFGIGCFSLLNFTVNAMPLPIEGTTSLCVAMTTHLTDAIGGGIWSSSNPAVASIDPATGIVTGHAAGTAVINYQLPGGCQVFTLVTVSSAPSDITGPGTVCIGAVITLADATPGGTWSTAFLSVATVGSASGIVTGVDYGTAVITYATLGCGYVTKIVTVNGNPEPIIGNNYGCLGGSWTYIDMTPGGTWSSSNPTVGTIASTTGWFTSLAPGTTMITYTTTCGFDTLTVHVYGTPTITGDTPVCVGRTFTLAGNPTGGTWTSGNTAIATVGSSSGIVTGVASGTTRITYVSLCGTNSVVVTVNPIPIISGTPSACVGATATLSASQPGGTWLSATPSVSAVSGTGTSVTVTGITAGTASISYTLPTGCLGTVTFSVNPLPADITGTLSVCAGSTTTLSDATPGGTWTSGSIGVATIGSSTGVVSGLTPGTAVITYSLPTGCRSTAVVTVTPAPVAITGPTSVCVGATITLSDTTTGGTWSSLNTTRATVGSSTGIVTGVSPGTVTIRYTVGTSCTVSTTITVLAAPLPIIGPSSGCVGATATMFSATPGGVWSTSNTAIGTIGSSSGVVSGIAPDTVTIFYTSATTGCSATKVYTVNPLPTITGTYTVCAGATTTLTGLPSGGTWSSSVSDIPVGLTNGVVAPISTASGSATITYALSTGCKRQATVNVIPATPPISIIAGPDHLCIGGIITLSDYYAGGTWSSSAPAVASLLPPTTSYSVAVTGLALGTTNVTYTRTNACGTAFQVKTVTVNEMPEEITGPTTICLGNTVTLGDATPGGSWSSSNMAVATIGSATGIITSLSVGTTIITYSTGVACAGTFTLTVIPGDVSSCSPCTVFGGAGFNRLGIGGTITANIPAGNYYLANDATVTGNITFTDAVILVAPGVTLNIDAHSMLTSKGSHLFSCGSSMWRGIALQNDYTTNETGKIVLTESAANKSTLIEDAYVGVAAIKPQRPNDDAAGSPYFVQSLNTVFNRNLVGIGIEEYSPGSSSITTEDAYKYEFKILNTVFTCREIDSYSMSGLLYPFTWPGTVGTGGFKSSTATSDFYMSPYYASNYPLTTCREGEVSYAGVVLKNIGTSTDPNYAYVQLGEAAAFNPFAGGYNSQLNMYDALAFGIYATNANVTSKNSVFTELRYAREGDIFPKVTPDNGGVGIYTKMNDGKKYKLNVDQGTYAYAPGPFGIIESPDFFYDCEYGVASTDYNIVSGYKANMRTRQVYSLNQNRKYGYWIQSSSYESIDVRKNTIYNTANGISVVTTLGAAHFIDLGGGIGYWTHPEQHAGILNVNNNTVQAAYGTATPTTQYCSFAISLLNAVNNPGSGYSPGTISTTGTVHADNNNIKDAYRGIQIGSYWAQQAFTNSNTIVVANDPHSHMSYGISHQDCAKNVIFGNTVNGSTFSAANRMSDDLRAYYSAFNINPEIYCNYATNIGRGFEFFQKNQGTYWHDNAMTNNTKGLVLNAAVLGPQGYTGHPNKNVWNYPSAWNMTDHLQTWVEGGVSAINSKLYVRSLATENPINNDSPPLFPTHRFNVLLGSIAPTTASPSASCFFFPPVIIQKRLMMHEQIAQRHVFYDNDSTTNDWLGQYATWQAMRFDTTITDSSAVLHSFRHLACHSRFACLTEIEKALAEGDSATASLKIEETTLPLSDTGSYTDSVNAVVVADDHSSDYLIDNQKAFYGIYLRYLHEQLTADDSLQIGAMAEMCPSRYGSVVYKARTLYTSVFNDLRVWNDDSCAKADTGKAIAGRYSHPTPSVTKVEEGSQQYSLFPNPSDGNITIVQQMMDDTPVTAEVFNMTGVLLYRESLLFAEGQSRLQLHNLAAGMYMLRLTDGKNRIFTYRFIIQ